MAIDRLPEHLKSRRTAEAIMAPSAILAGGAGASAAILVGLGLLPVIVAGLAAYGALVALRLPRGPRPTAGIDPKTLSETWRRFVEEALEARRRFDDVLRTASPGPVRDRLADIGSRLDTGVKECWRIARRGDAMEDGLATLDVQEVRADLVDLQRTGPGPTASERDEAAYRSTVEALESQIATAERIRSVAADARARLRLLDARLDEAVARAVELSLKAGDAADLAGLGSDVDSLVDDMEALRQGLEEASQASSP
ncbi:MAG: hypothetical protein M5T61_08470 [Acidimicrobiia bacterium]|nr:hypothetical protein [Acidimicrobiia bacterium]